MSLATIIKKIEEEAEAQGQQYIAQAKTEGEQIVAHARKEAEQEAKQILHRAQEDLQSFKNKQKATTLLRMRKEKLDNRQQILDKVFSKALDQIFQYEADRYRPMLRSILLSIEEERQGTIIPSKADKKLITKSFIDKINAKLRDQKRKLHFTLDQGTAEIEKGFLVDFKDFEMNYSVEEMLSYLWEEIKGEVSKRLFEDGNN